MKKLFSLCLLAALLLTLTACGSSGSAAPSASPVASPASSAAPSASASPSPSAAPSPAASSTPSPTAAPTASPKPTTASTASPKPTTAPTASPRATTAPTVTPAEETPHVHIPVVDPAVEATCQHTGLTEGSHCEECGEVLTAQTVIPLAPHRYVNNVCVWCGETDLESAEDIIVEYITGEREPSNDDEWIMLPTLDED